MYNRSVVRVPTGKLWPQEVVDQRPAGGDDSVEPNGSRLAVELSQSPQQARILQIEHEVYELGAPIPVEVELLDDAVHVADQQVNMYGAGTTLRAALNDYQASLVDYFEWLASHEPTLAEHLQEHLAWLRRHVRWGASRVPADRRAVEHTLTHPNKLRYQWAGKRDHDVYTLTLSGYQFGWTKISKGTGYRTLRDSLLAKIARQVSLQLGDFKAAIECTFNWEDYKEVLRRTSPSHADKIPDD